MVIFLVSMLAESNRVPFDTPEAEGEIVAGFSTEYGSIYFSIFVLAEYANAVAMGLLGISYFGFNIILLVGILYFYSMSRSIFPRLR